MVLFCSLQSEEIRRDNFQESLSWQVRSRPAMCDEVFMSNKLVLMNLAHLEHPSQRAIPDSGDEIKFNLGILNRLQEDVW